MALLVLAGPLAQGCRGRAGAALCVRWSGYASAARPPRSKTADLQRTWTVPNVLSASRITAAPLVGCAVIGGDYALGAWLLAACAATDAADGWIARRWRQQSALGSLLDPLGDKVLAGVLAASLAYKGLLPAWLAALILARDAALVAAGVCVRWRTLPPPRTAARFFNPMANANTAIPTITPTPISKANTVLQAALFGATLLGALFPARLPADLLPVLQWLVAGSTLWSAATAATHYRSVVRFIKK